jgi:uncharacterized protein YuzE
MKCSYYPETDTLYIDLSDKPSVDSQEIVPGVVLDFDENGRLVGIDIDRATHLIDLSHVDLTALPVASATLAAEPAASVR